MRRRFFVPQFQGSSASLEGEGAQHLGKVLRAEPGQLYELSDGAELWLGRIERVSRDRVEFSLTEKLAAPKKSLHISLLLAVVKFDRFEWAIEKATELGVSEITPVAAARSEKALVAAAPKRAVRWSKILQESAQQCRRLAAPVLHPLGPSPTIFSQASAQPGGLAEKPALIFFSEDPSAPALRDVLSTAPAAHAKRAVAAIGPEGGWTEPEDAAAQAAGFLRASLGANILRTETAVIAALASIQYALARPQP